MQRLFGTDGVRGRANQYPMTPEVALRLGQALSFHFSRLKHSSKKIVIGKDTRRSGYLFESALCSGVVSMGSRAIMLGPLPTPAIAFITTSMRADAGVVISASHNPFDDNGLKFFDHLGFKLSDEMEQELENFVHTGPKPEQIASSEQIGSAVKMDDAQGRYIEFVKATFPNDLDLDGIKIVIDCAHGAAYKIGPLILSELGAQVIPMNVEPNGFNINSDCGAMHPEAMCRRVVKEGAHLGIALDGDADRVVISDEKGQLLDGDHILALCVQERLRRDQLPKSTVVGTWMTNMGLEVHLKSLGVNLVRVPVGDRHIVAELRKQGYILGGEPSGHIIFLDKTTTGDGMIAALQVLSVAKRRQKPLSELASALKLFPQAIRNIRVHEKKRLEEVQPLQDLNRETTTQLKDRARVVLRYSGTEPLLRIMVEAEEWGTVNDLLDRYESCIHQHLLVANTH